MTIKIDFHKVGTWLFRLAFMAGGSAASFLSISHPNGMNNVLVWIGIGLAVCAAWHAATVSMFFPRMWPRLASRAVVVGGLVMFYALVAHGFNATFASQQNRVLWTFITLTLLLGLVGYAAEMLLSLEDKNHRRVIGR